MGGAWRLRLRGPGGAPAGDLELPLGGATPVAELRERAAGAAGVALARAVLKGGFPLRPLEAPAAGAPATAEGAGLRDRDLVAVERAQKPGAAGSGKVPPKGKGGAPGGRRGSKTGTVAGAAAAAPGPPAPLGGDLAAAVAAAAAARAAGAGPGPGAVVAGAGGGEAQAGVEAAPVAGGKRVRISSKGKVFEQKLPKRRRNIPGEGIRLGGKAAGGHSDDLLEPASNADAALGSVASAEEAAQHRMAAGLVAAARGGQAGAGGNVSEIVRALRRSMREAVKVRADEARAEGAVAAALAGAVEFKELEDGTGRVAVKYKSGPRSFSNLCVQDIPPPLLSAVLLAIAKGDAESTANLRPVAMALVSPRVFWAVVRHGGVGPGTAFQAALENLAPSVDWGALGQRQRKTPAKYSA